MRIRRRLLQLIPLLLLIAAIPAPAEGPYSVGGPDDAEGEPFIWTLNPLTYWTDLGNLGSNTSPDQLVADAFQAWEAIPTATISFDRAGGLGANVTASNALSVLNAIENCSTLPGEPLGGIAKPRSIIYDDSTGSILTELGYDPDSTLGFATATCLTSDGVSVNQYNRGYAVLNGKNLNVTELTAVMIHEFGHMIGLDHSQVNVECGGLFGCSGDADALEGLPTMFPLLINAPGMDPHPMATPALDDIAGLSELYPDASFATTTGRITGNILFSDNMTPAQGFNVIARMVDSPGTLEDESKIYAVSSSSGFLFTGDAGNPLVQISLPGFETPSPFGSREESRIGYFEIPGLPQGNYTVEVEAIDSGFIDGSGIGPLGALNIVFPLPSAACPNGEFYNIGEANNDLCDTSSLIPVAQGSDTPGIDIILNGTGPRYDAWEDGP